MAVLQRIVRGKKKEPFELPVGTTRIGRGKDNGLLLTPAAASKLHATIECFENHCEVTDLKSRNGTFVNGIRIEHRHLLKHGDTLDFAGATFVYLSEAVDVQDDSSDPMSSDFLSPLKVHTPLPDHYDPEQSIRRKIVREGDIVSPDSLQEFPVIDGPRIISVLDIHDLSLAGWSPHDSTRKVSHILRLAQAIIEYHEHRRINDVLETLLSFFPGGSHGLIAVENESAEGFKIMAAVSHKVDDDVFLCHPLIHRAVRQSEGLLVSDHWRNEPNSMPKLTNLNRQSLMCVPIPGPDRTCQGAVQLQASDMNRPFSETDLRRLAVLSHILGAALPGFRRLA